MKLSFSGIQDRTHLISSFGLLLLVLLLLISGACSDSKNDTSSDPPTDFVFTAAGPVFQNTEDVVGLRSFNIPNWDTVSHRGIDLVVDGTLPTSRIISPVDGTVDSIEKMVNPYSNPPGEFMFQVMIRVNDEWSADFMFEPASTDEADADQQEALFQVEVGSEVTTGQVIGDLLVRHETKSHVHYGLMRNGEHVCAYTYSSPEGKSQMETIVANGTHNAIYDGNICYTAQIHGRVFENASDSEGIWAFGIPDWDGPGLSHESMILVANRAASEVKVLSPLNGTVSAVTVMQNPLSNPPGNYLVHVSIDPTGNWTEDTWTLDMTFDVASADTSVKDRQMAELDLAGVTPGASLTVNQEMGNLIVGNPGVSNLGLRVKRNGVPVCPYAYSRISMDDGTVSPKEQFDLIIANGTNNILPDGSPCYGQ